MVSIKLSNMLTAPDLTRLVHEYSDGELTLMALVARKRFSQFNEAEVEALYAFLSSGEFTGAARE